MAIGRGSKPFDFSEIKTFSVRERGGRFDPIEMAAPPDVHQPLAQLFETLPGAGAARALLEAAEHIVVASAAGRRVVWLIGPEVIRLGLSPLVIKMMEQRLINAVALNGAAAVLDFEYACFGFSTESEDSDLADGLLGMAKETGERMNDLIGDGVRRGFGIGYCLSRGVLDRRPRFFKNSILAAAAGCRVPLTAHMTVGAEAIHLHATADGSLLGKGAAKDLQTLAGLAPGLDQGGVVVNIGSTGVLPEILLRAVTAARNLEEQLSRFVIVDMDADSVSTPHSDLFSKLTADGGKLLSLPGPRELVLPLLYAAIQRAAV